MFRKRKLDRNLDEDFKLKILYQNKKYQTIKNKNLKLRKEN